LGLFASFLFVFWVFLARFRQTLTWIFHGKYINGTNSQYLEENKLKIKSPYLEEK